MENKSGGFLVGKKNGKIYMHNDGSMGGFLVGRRHSQGGIKGHNESTGQPIEVETGEVQIVPNAVNSEKKHNFNGKMMTNREILSYLNSEGGGVKFKDGGNVENEYKSSNNVVNKSAGQPITYSGGEVIITRGAVSNPKKYRYNGKEMTTRQILSDINVQGGGVSFAEGGSVPDKMKCACSSYDFGGATMNLQDFVNMSEQEYQQLRLQKGIEKERIDHFNTLSKLNAGAITVEQALREIAEKEMRIDPKYPFGE